MVVGYMKDQIKNIRNQDEDQIQYLNGQLGDMSDINDSNVRIKHTFERQIVNQKDSLGKIYEITSQLDQRGPEEVLFYAAQVLSKLMQMMMQISIQWRTAIMRVCFRLHPKQRKSLENRFVIQT